MGSRKAPLDHLRSAKKKVTVPVWIALDSEVAARHQDIKGKVESARQLLEFTTDDTVKKARAKALHDLEAELAAVEAEAAESTQKFVARSLGRREYSDLIEAHPATDEQRKLAAEAGIDAPYNPETFAPALTAASIHVDDDGELVPIGKAFAEEIWSSPDWNMAELMALFGAAMNANQSRQVVDLGNGSGQTRS